MQTLSIKDTNALKGIALCMLLVHHLFYIQNGMYNDVYFRGVGIVQAFAVACKACVPLFVFLSGYGLMAVCEGKDEISWIKFFLRRFKKLFYNYWLIWIIFVPLGVIFFDRGFDKVYLHNLYWELPLDLMGLSNLIGLHGYNPTWWFYSCIIVLYFSFPLIFYILGKESWYGIVGLLVISLLLPFSSIKIFQTFKYYLLPFLLGALCRSGFGNNVVNRLLSIWGGVRKDIVYLPIVTVILFVIVFYRKYIPVALMFDTLTAVLIISMYNRYKARIKGHTIIQFIGKHSFNIFLFHTFIYYLYFSNLIYWSTNPFLIFGTLLVVSLLISMGIDKLRYLVNRYGIFKLEDNLKYSPQIEE